MEKEQVIKVLKKYEELAAARAKSNGSSGPERLGEEAISMASDYIPGSAFWSHMWWMCGEAQKIIEMGKTRKAMRWLGFIQGVLWSEGGCSINSLKEDNMPAGETLDPKRV